MCQTFAAILNKDMVRPARQLFPGTEETCGLGVTAKHRRRKIKSPNQQFWSHNVLVGNVLVRWGYRYEVYGASRRPGREPSIEGARPAGSQIEFSRQHIFRATVQLDREPRKKWPPSALTEIHLPLDPVYRPFGCRYLGPHRGTALIPTYREWYYRNEASMFGLLPIIEFHTHTNDRMSRLSRVLFPYYFVFA